MIADSAPTLFHSHTARKDGRTVAVLALDHDATTVRAEAYPPSSGQPVEAGPYRFATPAEARVFLIEAIEALTYLGCDVN